MYPPNTNFGFVYTLWAYDQNNYNNIKHMRPKYIQYMFGSCRKMVKILDEFVKNKALEEHSRHQVDCWQIKVEQKEVEEVKMTTFRRFSNPMQKLPDTRTRCPLKPKHSRKSSDHSVAQPFIQFVNAAADYAE